MRLRYIARRQLNTADGHVDGGQYVIDVVLRDLTPARKPVQFEARSLSGLRQTTVYRTDVEQTLQTVQLGGADLRNLREFLASTESGEFFEFEEADEFVSFERVGRHNESRAIKRGDGGQADLFSFRWTQRAT